MAAPRAPLPLGGERLAGAGALISGAGSEGEFLGVGAAIAVLFAAQGAHVGIVDHSSTRAENTLGLIGAQGGSGQVLVCDIRDDAQCKAAVAAFAGPPLNIVVNNAAAAPRGDVETVGAEDWRLAIDTVLTGALNLTRAATPSLKAGGGSVINISSIAASYGHGAVAYAAAKGGLEAMTRDMAWSLGPSGVRVNAVALGQITTPMVGQRPVSDRAMLPTEGTAWDAAFAALFLASPEAGWITAEVLRVDAGFSASGRARPSNN
jgi:NAD(P)-dependent dehydrogenase (short-subunit alcohol dehydrogenase family)